MAPVKKTLGELGRTYIAEWRESKGLTQEQLAEGIDLSRSTLSKIETSEAPYTQRSLEAIARVLNCQPFDLLRPIAAKEQQSPGATLRSALLSYGVDRSQMDLLIGIIDKFIPYVEAAEQQEQSQPGDQSPPANRRRVTTP